jgi:chemotaxis signal transduction protein
MWGNGMTDTVSRASVLRREFDRSFVDPPHVDVADKENLLAIRLAAQNFAIRLSEIAGLFADKKITPLPSAKAALLGIAGFRGSIVPVYDLQSLLGLGASQMSRWLVVAAGAPVAFSFEKFEGWLRVLPHAMTPQKSQVKHSFTRDFVRTENVLRPIIQLSSVLDVLTT